MNCKTMGDHQQLDCTGNFSDKNLLTFSTMIPPKIDLVNRLWNEYYSEGWDLGLDEQY